MSTGEVLLDILIILVAAKIAAELAERVKAPAVVGEIVAGILIGPSLLGLVSTNEVLEVLAELGVILLLLQVGMEMDLADLAAVGKASVSVAIAGVLLPLIGGYAAGIALGQDSNTSLFLGAALAATSVGITARVFSDLGALTTVEARTVLGAAVADDVLGLVLLTIVVRVVSDGGVSAGTVLSTVLLAVGFLVVTTALGGRIGRFLFRSVQRYSRAAGTLVALALAFALAFAELADAAKLAPIVGAFVAGLALSQSDSRDRIARELTPVGHLFIPVFFLQIGIAAEVERFVNPAVLGTAAVLTVVAVIGKVASSAAMLRSPGDKLLVGLGMLPRGEVGLIFATIGLREGVLDNDLYAALLLVVLLTTLAAPPLLRWRLRTTEQRGDMLDSDPKPASGWLWVDDGVVDLAATPPVDAQIGIALDAALLVSDGARPGSRLLDWVGHGQPPDWDAAATRALVDVLVRGNDRGWRFLDTSGVLVRSLPEVAEAIERWHRDPELTEPGRVVQFSTVDVLHDLVTDDAGAIAAHRRLSHPEYVVVAALILDIAGARPPSQLVHALTSRLALDEEACEAVFRLVEDQGVMRGINARVGGPTESSALEMALHVGDAEMARGLYLLDLALGPLDPVERRRLDGLLSLVLEALAPTGADDGPSAFAARRHEAIRLAGGESDEVLDRVRHAPRPFLLVENPERVVAQARLIEPRPERREVRVAVAPGLSGTVFVDVAARDRLGLLASVAEVFAAADLDVQSARVATWGDGAALESFTVEPRPGSSVPDAETLAAAIRGSLATGLAVEPLPEVEIAFNDAASPWYTIAELRHPDRPALLASITAALAAAGVSTHGAELITHDGVAIDRFMLTDQAGNKLARSAKDAIRTAVHEGTRPTGRLRRLVGR